MIFLAMILLGCLLGFAGAGGAGLTITLLSVGFVCRFILRLVLRWLPCHLRCFPVP